MVKNKISKNTNKKISIFLSLTILLIIYFIVQYFAEYHAGVQAHVSLTGSEHGSCQNNIIGTALFSPDDNIQNSLIYLINNEKTEILTAIYTITQKDVAEAFVNASKRGVKLEFVVDRSYGSDRFSKVPLLANNRIPIWVCQSNPTDKYNALMHDKFCIFSNNIENKKLLWTGSYNFTQSANLRNQENVVILENEFLINKFKKQFENLKSRSLLISGKATDINFEYNPDNNLESSDNSWKTVLEIIKNFIKFLK